MAAYLKILRCICTGSYSKKESRIGSITMLPAAVLLDNAPSVATRKDTGMATRKTPSAKGWPGLQSLNLKKVGKHICPFQPTC